MNNNAIEAGTFLERLKSTTSQSHTNLEQLNISLSIVDPAVTTAEYAVYLNLMLNVVKDAEENIFPALSAIIPDLQQRFKATALENDLAILGHKKNVFSRPLSANPSIKNIAFAMGIMYVIEGSTLGGRFILKNITDALGYTPTNGASYFAGYGNATGSYWKTFLGYLTKFEQDNNCGEEIIEGANYAFDAINSHFAKNSLQ